MGRPALELGQWGNITVTQTSGGKWRARTRIRDLDGVERFPEATADTKGRAETALEAKLRNRVIPAHANAKLTRETTMADAVEAWLEYKETETETAPTTMQTYRSVIRQHIVCEGSPIANLRLRQITTAGLTTMLSKLAKDHPAQACTARSVINGTLDNAVRHGAILTNPGRAIPRGTTAGKRPESNRDLDRVLTDEEMENVIALAETGVHATRDLADLAATMMGTGARLGEVCALTWDAIDLEAGTITMGPNVHRVAGEGLTVNSKGKTGALVARHMPQWLITRLMARRVMIDTGTTGLVFPSSRTKTLRDVSNTGKHMRKLFNEAGLEWATSHTYRHTVATKLDAAGATPKQIANQLGHTTERMANRYISRNAAPKLAAEVL